MGRESSLAPIPHLADGADALVRGDGADARVVSPGPQMTRALLSHVAVREQAPGEVRPGQDGAERGAALLHHLDLEPYPPGRSLITTHTKSSAFNFFCTFRLLEAAV